MPLAPEHEQTLRAHALDLGVDPDLAIAVGLQESGPFGEKARSRKGARGLMQVMPATSKELAPKYGPDLSRQGVGYLGELEKRYAGLPDSRQFALAAYNAGPTTLARARARARKKGLDDTRFASIQAFLPRETRKYVPAVLAKVPKPPSPVGGPTLKGPIGIPFPPPQVRGPLTRTVSIGSLR